MSTKINYAKWKNDYQNILSGFSNKTIMIAYSGGKDSSAVLNLMNEAQKEFDFKMEAHGVVFPNHVLTTDEQYRLNEFWREKDIEIYWHESSIAEEELLLAANKGQSPCQVCNTAKKNVLINHFKEAHSNFESIVIVMSYSLWDLVSATIEHILESVYSSGNTHDTETIRRLNSRFNETSQRFYPLLILKEGLTIFKPLINYNDQHILEYLATNKILTVADKCKYKSYRPKRWFSNYYHNAGLEFDIEKVRKFAQNALALPDIEYFENVGTGNYFKKMI
jgi:tRNA(Ile)-lysidine synthase TilS/MesJ